MGFEAGSEVACHSIGVVARRTGLLADRIHAWERRYGSAQEKALSAIRRLDRCSLEAELGSGHE